MASKKEKKDAETSTRRNPNDVPYTDSDSDSYYTAEGSAQSFKKEEAEIPETPETPEPPLDPLPWQQAPTPSRSQRLDAAPKQSIVSNNRSVFGEDLSPNYNSEVRRPTIEWPPSGCIHIPLRPTNNYHSNSDDNSGNENNDSDANLDETRRRS